MNISLDTEEYRKQTLLKPCVVKDATVRFSHGDKKYHLHAECFLKLEGKTVLVDAGLNVYHMDERLGVATPVKKS